MNEWPKLVILAFELILTSIFIALVALLVTIGQNAGAREQDRLDSIAEMKEYREYNKWDNNNRVYYQDIVELVLLNQNSVRFKITKKNGSVVQYYTTTPSTEYTRGNLHTSIYESNAQYYEAILIRDIHDPGKVLGYEFIAR